jgi:hypothetical protein
MRWRHVVEKVGLRYRDPYTARHSCVSWHLMIGRNLLWCSHQRGHSVQVMLTNYGAWIENATQADVEEIKRSMVAEPAGARVVAAPYVPSATPESPGFASNLPVEEGRGRLSWRKTKYFNNLTGGADGTRTREALHRNQQLTDSTGTPSPSDPLESPDWSLERSLENLRRFPKPTADSLLRIIQKRRQQPRPLLPMASSQSSH